MGVALYVNFDAAALASESALILRDLNQLDAALARAQAAVALRESGRAPSLALNRITLVDIHVRRGDLDAAVQTGHDLLSTSPTLGSVRVIQQLDALRQLLEPHRAYGPMRQYLTRFDYPRVRSGGSEIMAGAGDSRRGLLEPVASRRYRWPAPSRPRRRRAVRRG